MKRAAPPWPPLGEDDLDSLHVDVRDRERIVEALAEACAAEELAPAETAALPSFGRFSEGEELPTVRRFLVAPPGPRWTTVLLSAPDWEHDWIDRVVRRLGCRAAYLMLHDGDVLTVHLSGPEGLLAAHVTSHVHFDQPPEARSLSLHRSLELLAGRSITGDELEAAIAPPGRIDVDGRLAFLRTAALLGIPEAELGAYRHALDDDLMAPRPELADWLHVGFAWAPPEEDEAAKQATGEVLPFRPAP